MVADQRLPLREALLAVSRSLPGFGRIALARRIHQPRRHVGGRLTFANGSCAEVFRETTVDALHDEDPVVLVVEFRLHRLPRLVHRLFELVSVLFTPLFAGFGGFVSKLWLRRDEDDVYRGIYEWDGADRATRYAEAIRSILSVVSVPGSVDFHVVPATTRSRYIAHSEELADSAEPTDSTDWWRVS